LLTILALAFMGGSAASAAAVDQMTPVLASVIAPPIPVRQSDGRWKIAYELELTNATDSQLTIESVEVRAPGRDVPLASLPTSEVAANLVLPGGTKTALLGPGQAGVLFVNLSFDRRDAIPAAFVHRLAATASNPKGMLPEHSVEEVAPVNVATSAPVILGPPLRGDRWIAAASCCASYHRHAVLPINGRRYLAQRFAIDWIQVDAQHRLAEGDPTRNQSYPQYGAEAIAVADGVVVHVVDGLPESPPGAFPSNITLATADGNSVVLDLGGGRFALYAHFQPGSVRVHEGEHVKRGQVLGLVGSSGNSDAPHLHFHVMDGRSPLASNGLPYVIDRFEVVGQATSADDLDSALKQPLQPIAIAPPHTPAARTNELPADLAVVRFPGDAHGTPGTAKQ
jgi:Peptidase family M23